MSAVNKKKTMLTAATTATAIAVVHEIKAAEDYYDSMGLALCFGVIDKKIIALSSKHWLHNYYIETFSKGTDLWQLIRDVIAKISREFTHLDMKNPYYAYVSNLNREQTEKVYYALLNELQVQNIKHDIVECWELYGWKVNAQNATPFHIDV